MGLLFLAVVVGHVILISSQVQSRSGVPVLEGVTFGAFAHVQQGTASMVKAVQNGWTNYVYLRGVRAENASLRSQVADLEIRLQEQRALALRADRLQSVLGLKPFVSAPTRAANELKAIHWSPPLKATSPVRGIGNDDRLRKSSRTAAPFSSRTPA